jgi:hypothetical protein
MTTPATPRTSLANTVTLRLLHAPLVHRLIDTRVCELRFAAARSGREVTLPVMYAQRSDRVVVFVGRSHAKRWWRNFVEPHPVAVWLRGQGRTGRGHVAFPATAEHARAQAIYSERYPHITTANEPFVAITLDPM